MSVLDAALTQIEIERAATDREAARNKARTAEREVLHKQIFGRWQSWDAVYAHEYEPLKADAYRSGLIAEMFERHQAVEPVWVVQTEHFTLGLPLTHKRVPDTATQGRLIRASKPQSALSTFFGCLDDVPRDDAAFLQHQDGSLYANREGQYRTADYLSVEKVAQYAARLIVTARQVQGQG